MYLWFFIYKIKIKGTYEKRLDLVGQKINMLTVIEQVTYTGGRTRFVCKCDCGNIKEFNGSKLKFGSIKSCGCLRYTKEYLLKLSKRHRLEWGESSKNRLITTYKRNAKIKNIFFDLTKEQMETLFKGNCFYCGRAPYNTVKHKGHYGDYTYNGIDRLINTKGYTMDNVVSCCSECNFLKNSYDINDFINIIRMINENTKNYNINL